MTKPSSQRRDIEPPPHSLQVLEIGPVGRALQAGTNNTQLFIHAQRPSEGFGDAAQIATALANAALAAAAAAAAGDAVVRE